MMASPATKGIDHIGLTVRDLAASKAFFVGALGWEQFGGNPDYPSAYMTDGNAKLTLWECKTDAFNEFDRHANIGLHHLALKVTSAEELYSVFEAVQNWPGVEVEFAPEFSGKGPKEHFMVYEPGGTRLEVSFDPR
ncbi:Catechol 2,3-dioxygenase [Aliiroseovarius crassostreae]|uniref:Glyoxalase n=2 Tax=Aliiroseovarius crassostreae TaxID=154981 RepID=A0A0P7JQ99_9RHOB|nr:glyoxalase [Aliiroseovarius crassostreae]SFU95975.1 Catechol 2,3-dioxygenase [Aliiroseovarius crassostreae]